MSTVKTAKTVNYTDEQTEQLIKVYTSASTDEERAQAVAQLQQDLNKSSRSIVGKLNREGVYIKPQPRTKTGGKIERKSQIVAEIAALTGNSQESLDSIESGTKSALIAIRGAFNTAQAQIKALEAIAGMGAADAMKKQGANNEG